MSVNILKCAKPLRLAKVWRADGTIEGAARVKWFKAREADITNLDHLQGLIEAVQGSPRFAFVKERIAENADPRQLRRKCSEGVDAETGEYYPAGLEIAEQNWTVVDIDGLQRPDDIDWSDGLAQATYARSLLPLAFQSTACVWQLSGSAGHPEKRSQIRMHMFFMCETPILPQAWKSFFAHLPFVDKSIFDPSHLIYTAAPIIESGTDPIAIRHGTLGGDQTVCVPDEVIKASRKILLDEPDRPAPTFTTMPMPKAAAGFIDLIAESHVLRSRHLAYQCDRSRRLALCSMVARAFGIRDEGLLAEAFIKACVGPNDPNAAHDLKEALSWAAAAPPHRTFTITRLLRDASISLRNLGMIESAIKAARLADIFRRQEYGVTL